jgi:lipoprotein-releasing system permease protein
MRKTYFYTGILIVFFGIVCGLILGTAICVFQIYTEYFSAAPDLPFPVNINFKNYAVVVATTGFFGLMISWFFSKINKNLV